MARKEAATKTPETAEPEGGVATRRVEESGEVELGLLPGTRYRVLGRLAVGGMGEILDAEHEGLRRRVVVKLLRGDLDWRPDLLDRMRMEAQALALLNHPNIVQVTDFGETSDARTFLVMERLYGRTLAEELAERGQLPEAEAIAIVRQMLAGLSAAHEVGIIHRDIKLDNIFLCDAPDGSRSVKLLDFGIAKVTPKEAATPDGRATAAPAARRPPPLAYPTALGSRIGTPRFFSPEQADGVPVDARADIYSVGMVLYVLLAGQGPFDHYKAASAMILAHMTEAPTPPSLYTANRLPPELDRAVLKALAKKPDDRFASARAFSEELALISSRLDNAGAAPVPGRWAVTELIKTLPKKGAEERPSAPTFGKSTERIPELAERVDAQRAEATAKTAGALLTWAQGTPARASESAPSPPAARAEVREERATPNPNTAPAIAPEPALLSPTPLPPATSTPSSRLLPIYIFGASLLLGALAMVLWFILLR